MENGAFGLRANAPFSFFFQKSSQFFLIFQCCLTLKKLSLSKNSTCNKGLRDVLSVSGIKLQCNNNTQTEIVIYLLMKQ